MTLNSIGKSLLAQQPLAAAKVVDKDFIFSADGLSAKKQVTMKIDGEEKIFHFTVLFPSKNSSEKTKLQFLKQFSDNKIEKFTEEAHNLGVGKKFSSMNFSYEKSGSIKKLNMQKIDGTIKTLDLAYFKRDKLEPEKQEKLERKFAMFQNIQKIVAKDFIPFHDDAKPKSMTGVKKSTQQAKDQIRDIQEKKRDIEQERKVLKKEEQILKDQLKRASETLKDFYIGDKKVIDILENHLKSHPEADHEEIGRFIEEEILTHPDLYKKST